MGCGTASRTACSSAVAVVLLLVSSGICVYGRQGLPPMEAPRSYWDADGRSYDDPTRSPTVQPTSGAPSPPPQPPAPAAPSPRTKIEYNYWCWVGNNCLFSIKVTDWSVRYGYENDVTDGTAKQKCNEDPRCGQDACSYNEATPCGQYKKVPCSARNYPSANGC